MCTLYVLPTVNLDPSDQGLKYGRGGELGVGLTERDCRRFENLEMTNFDSLRDFVVSTHSGPRTKGTSGVGLSLLP